MSLWHSGSLSAIDSLICGSNFIEMKGYQRSNLGHWSRCGRLRQGRRGGGAESGSGSPEPGVAHATGHRFWWGLTLRTQRSEGNSPRGSSKGGGDRSRAHDGGRLAPTFGVVDDELQRSANDEIRLRGAAWHVEGRRGAGSTRRGLQRSDSELGQWLGFQYLWIKIHRRTGTIYRAFCTES
jgi:hypothetical protein